MSGIVPRALEHKPVLGILFVLVAYFLFSIIDTSAKWLALAGLPAVQLAFMRYAGHFVISLAVVLKAGGGIGRFASDRPVLTILRGLLLVFSTMLNFVAIQYLPLTLTSTILFLAPIIVCTLSWPILGERVGPFRAFAIFAGFVGVLIAIRPFGESMHWAVLLSLGAAFTFSLYAILTRMLSGVVATGTMQFYSGLTGTVALAPIAIPAWLNPDGALGWIILIGLGVFGYLGHELLTRAHGYAPASRLSPFGYSLMIYFTIAGYLVFGTVPDFWTIVGAIIIVGAGLLIWARERKHALS